MEEEANEESFPTEDGDDNEEDAAEDEHGYGNAGHIQQDNMEVEANEESFPTADDDDDEEDTAEDEHGYCNAGHNQLEDMLSRIITQTNHSFRE